MSNKKKILVVVDMQNDFIDGPLGTPEARGIVDKVCEKIRGEEWIHIYSTMDIHFDDYLETQEGRKLPIKHCICETEGSRINEKIRVAIEERTLIDSVPIVKTTFGSTCLIDNLRSILVNTNWRAKDIDLTLVGVCTDICVISNALLLKAHFPEINIAVDAACCAGSTPEKHRMALEVMKSCQIDILEDI